VAIAAEAVRAIIGLVCAEEDEEVLGIHEASLVTDGTRAREGVREIEGKGVMKAVRKMDVARQNGEPARAMHGPAALDQLPGLSVVLRVCACVLAISRAALTRWRSVL